MVTLLQSWTELLRQIFQTNYPTYLRVTLAIDATLVFVSNSSHQDVSYMYLLKLQFIELFVSKRPQDKKKCMLKRDVLKSVMFFFVAGSITGVSTKTGGVCRCSTAVPNIKALSLW